MAWPRYGELCRICRHRAEIANAALARIRELEAEAAGLRETLLAERRVSANLEEMTAILKDHGAVALRLAESQHEMVGLLKLRLAESEARGRAWMRLAKRLERALGRVCGVTTRRDARGRERVVQ